MHRLSPTFLLLATALFSVTLAQGELIYHEAFPTGGSDYIAGNFLSGQNPTGANTDAAWSGGSEGVVGVRVTGTGLTYSGLTVSGGAAESFRTGTGTATGTYVVSRSSADNATTTIVNGEVLYFSALVNRTAGSAVGVGADFENRNPFGIGFDTSGRAGIYTGTAGTWNALTVDAYDPGTYFIVGRMIPDNGTTTNPETIEFLAINPTSDIMPGSPIATFGFNAWGNVTTTDTLDNFNFLVTKAGSATVVGTVDELRWGTTYASVTPVIPEPGTLALVGLSLASLVLFRRWR